MKALELADTLEAVSSNQLGEFEGEDGRLAVTRRAVVRAAAAIGEKMP